MTYQIIGIAFALALAGLVLDLLTRPRKAGEIEAFPARPSCPEGICDGSGECPDYELSDGEMRQDGTRPCPCRL